eukprot:GAHX01000088.1.p1 GENE.GAHX01000088.1~~GAHX01000088.1.p1  ORF type:complete len:112 (+),score=19.24 GAHX01000088.1:38-373(+)
MADRVTQRRRCPYTTKSNRTRHVKTPGGSLKAHYIKQKGIRAKCGECNMKLNGMSRLTSVEQKTAKKNKRTVSRAFGGNKCANCVKRLITRSFLREEHKVTKTKLKSLQNK